jgi:hypothetical protein
MRYRIEYADGRCCNFANRIDGTVLINRDIFDAYLERFHEPATGKGKEEIKDER